jgi:hypothetical protein
MSRLSNARFARLASRRPAGVRRRRTLILESLEDRAVPANNITVVDASVDDSAFIDVKRTGQTITISTKLPDAQLSIETIRAALADPTPAIRNVVITTDVANGGTDGDEAGDIVWDDSVAGSLDFTGFGTGRTLTFETVDGTGATGNVTLTGVAFLNAATDDQISLEFDTTATNGNVTFDSNVGNTVIYSAEAVLDLTVNDGSGAFNFADSGFLISAADAGGAVSITAGDVFISHLGGLTAGADFTVTADTFTLADGSGLLATGNLTIATTATATVGDNTGLTAETGAVSITAADLTIGSAFLTAGGDLTANGASSVIMQFTQPNAGGNLTISGGDLSLTGLTVASSGDTHISGTSSVGIDFLDLFVTGDASISGGAAAISALNLAAGGSVSIIGTSLDLANSTVTTEEDGALELNSPAITTDGVTLGAGSGLAIHGNVTAANLLDVRATGAMLFDGTVDGADQFFVESNGTVTFQGDVGSTAPINDVTFNRGLFNFGPNDLSALRITVGASLEPVEATLASAGTVTGDITVQFTGNLAPGGLGTVGNMTVRGNVRFVTPSIFGNGPGGDFAVDFGPGGTADKLIVVDNPITPGPDGLVDLSAGAMLGGGLGTGQLTGPSAVIIDPATAVVGQFTNAPIGAGVILGTDAITVISYAPQVVVVPMPASPNGIVLGADPDDGTGFKAVLTGGGQLVFGKDWRNFMFLVVRNSTPLSKLTITTTANGADDIVTFNAGILINGPIAGVSAPKVNIGSQFRATGYVKSAVIRDLTNLDNARIEFGGVAANLSTITARNIFGSVITGSTLTSLKVAQNLGAQVFVPFLPDSVVSAPGIGTITAKGMTAMVDVSGRLNLMTITGDAFGGVSATTLGSFSAGSFQGDINVDGTATTIKTTRRLDGNVKVGSLASFTAGGGAINLESTGLVGTIVGKLEGVALDVVANSVASVKVTGGLSGNGTGWNVTNGIGRLTADVISDLNLRAKFIGPVLVTGNLLLGYAGNISFSTFTLTGNDGTTGAFGLKSLTAKGRVESSLIDVERGNVGAVTVGRFYRSQLHVNYTPDAVLPFDQGGTFGQGNFSLLSFKTTAVPTADPTNPFHWAFLGSEIAAQSIGTVTLSGLNTDNQGVAFGIKEERPGAVVKVLKADAGFPANLLNVALQPSTSPIGGDFFFLDV